MSADDNCVWHNNISLLNSFYKDKQESVRNGWMVLKVEHVNSSRKDWCFDIHAWWC